MGKFESSKGAQGRDQIADQFGHSTIPLGLLRPAGDMSPRNTGVSVTAGAIGMGLAAQSASQDGLMAFAATLPGADVLASLAQGETQSPTEKTADVAGGEDLGGAFQPDGAPIEADGVDPLEGASFDADDAEMPAAPRAQESHLTSHIGVDGSAIGSVSIQGTARTPTTPSVVAQLNEAVGAAEKVVPTIAVVPGDHLLPDDIAGAEGPVGSIVGSVIGDGDLAGGVLGEGGALDSVLGEDGVVGVLLGGDGLVSGLLGDGGIVGAVLGEDGVVDGLLGEDGLVGGVLGDDGLVGGLLGEDSVVDDLLGENGLVQGVLGEDGIVDGLLGEDGVVGGVLGDNGVVGGVLGEDGLVGGVVDGLLGGGSGDESLAGGLLGEDGVIDGLAGEDGLLGGVLGDNGVVSGVLGEDGLVGDLLSDNGLLGGLLGGGSSDPTDVVPADLVDTTLSEVPGVLDTGAQTVTQVADGLLGGGSGDESLAGGLLGEDGVIDGLAGEDGLVESVLGDNGVVGGVLGDDGLVGGLLGDDGLLGGLLGGGSPEPTEIVSAELADTTGIEASDVFGATTETVAQVSDDIVGEDGLVGGAFGEGDLAGGLLGDDGVVDDLMGDDGLVGGLVGGLLGGGVVEVEETEPAELSDMAVPETSDAPEDETLVSGPALNPDVGVGGVVDDIPVVGGVLSGLLGGQAASPRAVEPVVERLGTEPSDDALLVEKPAEEGDSSDDGFLDTLVAGAAEDSLGSVETLLDSGATLLDGLLGENDVFGLNVVETDEGDDLFAGLTGEKGLTGSLVEQDVLGLSDPVGGDAPDSEVDNLLNDILAGGVSDITGEDGAFDALFGSDTAAEETGELLGAEDAAVAEAGAVEGALDILFDQGGDQGHSLLGGLLQDTFDSDNA